MKLRDFNIQRSHFSHENLINILAVLGEGCKANRIVDLLDFLGGGMGVFSYCVIDTFADLVCWTASNS